MSQLILTINLMLSAVRIIGKHAYCVGKCKLLNFSTGSVQAKLGVIRLKIITVTKGH